MRLLSASTCPDAKRLEMCGGHLHSWRATSRKATRSAACTRPLRRTTPTAGLPGSVLKRACSCRSTRSTSCEAAKGRALPWALREELQGAVHAMGCGVLRR